MTGRYGDSFLPVFKFSSCIREEPPLLQLARFKGGKRSFAQPSFFVPLGHFQACEVAEKPESDLSTQSKPQTGTNTNSSNSDISTKSSYVWKTRNFPECFASLRLNDPPEKHDLFIVPQSNKIYILEQKKHYQKKNKKKKHQKIWVVNKKKSALLQVCKQNDFFKGRVTLVPSVCLSRGQCSDSWGLAHVYELSHILTNTHTYTHLQRIMMTRGRRGGIPSFSTCFFF